MKAINSLKEIGWFKNRKIWILLLVEMIILIYILIGIFSNKKEYHIDNKDFVLTAGTYDEAKGCYIDAQAGITGVFATSPDIALDRGVYKVEVLYDTDVNIKNSCSVNVENSSYGSVISNYAVFYNYNKSTNFNVYLTEHVDNFEINFDYAGTGYLSVKGVNIYETNLGYYIFLFCMIITFTIINGLTILYLYDKKFGIKIEKKNVMIGLVAICIFSCLGLFTDYLINASDPGFHMCRIEGIVQAIKSGQIPVRIEPSWLEGYGYASSIFYSDFFLYIPAFFRLLGFSMQTAYKMYVVLVNVATCLVTYWCIGKIFKNKYIGLFGSMLYTLSIFRLSYVYKTGDVGHYTSMIFLPVLFYGFYKIFTEDIKLKEYSKNWIIPVIGFTGIIQSHVLTTELAGAFVVITCIIFIKKVFRKETFLVLVKTVLITILVNLWFIVPFLDYFVSMKFNVTNDARIGNLIQEKGTFIPQLFQSFFGLGNAPLTGMDGMYGGELPLGLGLPIMGSSAVFLYFYIVKAKLEEDSVLIRAGVFSFISSIVLMFMTTVIFPWDWIQKLNPTINKLCTTLQYPTRLLFLASILLTFVSCLALYSINKYYGGKTGKVFALVVVLIAVLTTSYYFDNMLSTATFSKIYDPAGTGTYVSGAEYLLVGTNQDLLVGKDPIAGNSDLVIENYTKEYLDIEMYVENNGVESSYVELPLLYYKGYVAEIEGTNNKLTVIPGSNNVVRVNIPDNFTGNVHVLFQPLWYWRLSEAVSILTVICCFMIGLKYRYKKKK